jgi:hypothetical protein
MSSNVPYDVRQRGAVAIAFYKRMVAAGTAPLLAEMLALKSPPRGSTDSTYFSDLKTLDKQFSGSEDQGDMIVNSAKKNGYNPSSSDCYMPALARFPGDPKAFIKHSDGRTAVQKRYNETVADIAASKRRQEQAITLGGKRLAKPIRDREYQRLVAANPDVKRRNKKEVLHEIVSKHGS